LTRRTAAVVLAIAVAGVAGVLVGRLTATTSAADPHWDVGLPAVRNGSLGAPHGPIRMRGDLPTGFTDDRAGALSCASIAAETLIDYVQSRRITPASTWVATYTNDHLDGASLQKILNWNPRLYQLSPSDKPSQLAPSRAAVGVTEIVPVG
jgi:hypothetical protein